MADIGIPDIYRRLCEKFPSHPPHWWDPDKTETSKLFTESAPKFCSGEVPQKTSTVPLVVYKNGMCEVIGEARVFTSEQGDMSVLGTITAGSSEELDFIHNSETYSFGAVIPPLNRDIEE